MSPAWAEDKATQECDLSAVSRPVAQGGQPDPLPTSFYQMCYGSQSDKLILRLSPSEHVAAHVGGYNRLLLDDYQKPMAHIVFRPCRGSFKCNFLPGAARR
jgi:hypothetical protein